jgi:hypothetical protein
MKILKNVTKILKELLNRLVKFDKNLSNHLVLHYLYCTIVIVQVLLVVAQIAHLPGTY